jgi:hypothetical protein
LQAGAARCGRALLLLALAASGCQSWFLDERPWLLNATRETLEVESIHADGHSLRVRLSPGARFAMGVAEQPIREIVVRHDAEVVLRVSEKLLQSCLAASARVCHGWSLQPDGVTTLGLR